jgi:hypothetical protein
MPATLLDIFPTPGALLALAPEELAGVLLEVAPNVLQNGIFGEWDLLASLYPPNPNFGYPQGSRRAVTLATAEALSWLIAQGLLIVDPDQTGRLYVISRRAKNLKTRADVEAFRKGGILPVNLLQSALAEKVSPQFSRGDHDIAVFQAFKEVEVAVRKAANAKGAGYPDDLVGTKLMRSAFNPDKGELADQSLVFAEREAEASIFAGAIGRAKNPAGHRDVDIGPQEAARLIVVASYLLSIIESRA